MLDIVYQLNNFMESSINNKWLVDDSLSIYVRKGKHCVSESKQITYTIDIANIKQIAERYEGKGYFRTFMIQSEQFGIPVMVENIYNPKLINMLKKNGYTIIKKDGGTHAIKITL